MVYRLRQFECVECGRPAQREMHSYQRRVCHDCGLDSATRAAREMAARSGPAWDRFMLSAGPRGAGAHKHREK